MMHQQQQKRQRRYGPTGPDDDAFVRFPSRRSVIFGRHSMVASSQPLACQAGLEILRSGGNAADAAVAIAAALNVTEPSSTGIGGDCFCLFYDAKARTVSGLNGSGRSPAALTLTRARTELGLTGDRIPPRDINAATVPGAAAGLLDTVAWFGSGRLSVSDILAPAIELAEKGFAVSEISANMWKDSEEALRTASPNHGDMLIDGRAPEHGEIMIMPNLARTFRELADKGKDGFYKGRIAHAIVDLVRSKGGVMTLEDLAAHSSERAEPISIDYEGVRVWECPPNGQGITALLALGILRELQAKGKIPRIEQLEHNSTAYLHAVIESLRLAFAASLEYVGDPQFSSVPVEELLSEKYLSTRANIFDPTRAAVDVRSGSPVASSDTVYFSVVDDEGNACSFITSNYVGFGTAAIPKDCGFTLHCRGACFVLREGHPNCLEGGKRPYHTIIPAMVTRPHEDGSGDDLWLSYGVMGGFMQPQGHVQVLLNVLHFGLNPQTALDAPRVCIGPLEDLGDGNVRANVDVEEGVDQTVVDELRRMGHDVRVVTGWGRALFGRGQIIERRIDARTGIRVWSAGSDPRGDGCAIGW